MTENAFLPQSNYRRHSTARHHLARHRNSAYHRSRVSQSNTTDNERLQSGRDARAPSIIAIVGPTASGKSELGIELALRLGGEIINCDSVLVYQGIQIATAKVPMAERRGVPHHLIDFVSPLVNYTAADWARAAIKRSMRLKREIILRFWLEAPVSISGPCAGPSLPVHLPMKP